MKSKKKVIKNKYRLGTQQVAVPNKGSLSDIASPTLALAQTGGTIAGPWGAAAGAAIGLGKGISDYTQANNRNRLATDQNKYIEKNDLVEDPMIMQSQFKKGTKGIRTKYGKYPDGTKSIKGLGPEYDKIQSKIKEFDLGLNNDWSSAQGDSLTKYLNQSGDFLRKNYSTENEPNYMDQLMSSIGDVFASGSQGTDSKPIEVEKDELIFAKKGNKYILKADFKGGKSHALGGEDYIASEGDIIFPSKDRKKVLNAYKRGDSSTLEAMRRNLPKDEVKVSYEDGGEIFRNTSKGDTGSYRYNQGKWGWDKTGGGNFEDISDANGISAIEKRLAGKFTPYVAPTQGQGIALNDIGIPSLELPFSTNDNQGLYREGGVDRENLYATPEANVNISPKLNFNKSAFGNERKMTPVPTTEFSNPYAGTDLQDAQATGITKNKFDINKAVGTGLEIAPILYNTARGLSKAEKVQRNYYNPERYQYQDISSPARRAAQEAQNVDKYNINTTRGSRGQIQSYLQGASNSKYKKLADIGNFEGGRKMNVYNQNTEQDNQAKLQNLQLSNQYNQIDDKNRERRNDFLAGATGQASSYQQKKNLAASQAKRDEALDAMQNKRAMMYDSMYADYGFDPETMEVDYKRSRVKKYKKGTKKINKYK